MFTEKQICHNTVSAIVSVINVFFLFFKVKRKTFTIFPLNLAGQWAYACSCQYCCSHIMGWYCILNYLKISMTLVPKAQSFHSICSDLIQYIPMLTLN